VLLLSQAGAYLRKQCKSGVTMKCSVAATYQLHILAMFADEADALNCNAQGAIHIQESQFLGVVSDRLRTVVSQTGAEAQT
jgi:hypothetical protein